MSNGTSNDLSGAISNLMETLGKLGQQQVEMINNGIKTASQMIEPLGKTSTDLMGNILNGVNQVLQSVSAATAPKK
jgi:chlorosome envelope protein B